MKVTAGVFGDSDCLAFIQWVGPAVSITFVQGVVHSSCCALVQGVVGYYASVRCTSATVYPGGVEGVGVKCGFHSIHFFRKTMLGLDNVGLILR